MSEEKEKVHPTIEEMEEKYPEMTKEFKKIMRTQYLTFCKKMLDYGTDNIALGKDLSNEDDRRLSQMGIWFRMMDKINRLKQLVVSNNNNNVGESVTDTYQDLSVYAILAQLVKNGKWGK